MRQFSRSAAREWGLHLSGAIALSAKNFRFVERYLGLPEADVLLLPNATDTEIFSPGGRDEARLRLGVRQDAKLVLFVGHLIERKGPLRLLSALATSEEQVVAAFLGSGPQVPRDVNVCFVGEVSRDVVVDWMRAADVFCLPTLAEGSPNVVIEALACGLPVVTTDLTGVQHLRHLEAVRLVCARASAKELMHAIDDMLVLSANAAVRKAARAYAEQHSLKVRSRRILQFMSSRIKSAEGTSSLHQAAAAREPILGPAQ
jgi:glycosyltransferase involved in cell wall biosynthesis